jgi:Cu/Ag efflux pump CusA
MLNKNIHFVCYGLVVLLVFLVLFPGCRQTREEVKMAVAISGGMLSSTFLTLAVVPVIYSYLDQLANWKLFKRVKGRVMAHE